VAITGIGSRAMISSDGITWHLRATAADNAWRGVCYIDGLKCFVAVGASGTGNRAMRGFVDQSVTNYLGPKIGQTAMAGGICARSLYDDTQIGVESFDVGAADLDGNYRVRIRFHRDVERGEAMIMLAARPQNGANTFGTNDNMARCILRSTAVLPTVAGATRPRWDWVNPGEVRAI
jgi:hypothetical protein